jgi:hypothetical protein
MKFKKYQYQVEDGIYILIEYTVEEYRPATYDQPEEGGEVEIISAHYIEGQSNQLIVDGPDITPILMRWEEVYLDILTEIQEYEN